MKFQAVIFDLDGTLLNTLDDLCDATNSVLRSNGYPEHDQQTIKTFVGEGLRVLTIRALPESQRTEENIQRCFELLKTEYGACSTNKTHPYAGIPELLDHLTDCGVKMNILTNKADEPTQQIAAKLLSRWRFSIILGARPENPAKPDPTTALNIADQLGISPQEFIFIGDTRIDMQTAGASGMYGVGAMWGCRPVDELITGVARILLRSPQELMPWLEGAP